MSNMQYAALISQSSGQSTIKSTAFVKPTIFDILAQENMQSLFRSSFRHLFNWLASHLRFIQRFQKFKDEIYLILHSTIEFIYLKGYDSLFSEYFYGMKRFKLNSNRMRLLSILCSIIVPYLKSKMDEFYEEIERTNDHLASLPLWRSIFDKNKNSKIKFKILLLKCYPYLHLGWSSLIWFYRFRFIIDKTEFHSPFLRVLNLKLTYRNEIDTTATSVGSKFFNSLLTTLSRLFTGFIFFIQFLNWFENYDQHTTSLHNNVHSNLLKNKTNENDEYSIPPPTLPPKLIKNNERLFKKILQDKTLCPLCLKKRTSECVLTVSGFAFCYPCIFKFTKEHKRCPLTQFPCDTSNIVRLYTSE
jgi:peroxin-12